MATLAGPGTTSWHCSAWPGISARATGLGSTFSTVVWVERTALGVALEWAVARGQTPEQLHAALAAYRDLPKMPLLRTSCEPKPTSLRIRSISPPVGSATGCSSPTNGNTRSQPAFASMLFDLATTPWERVRARRVNRLIASAAIQDAIREPWQRSQRARPRDRLCPEDLTERDDAYPELGGYIIANDHNEVARRALVQVLAIREWQLKHGGQFPQSLDALVPEELPSLPGDPYSGRPFGYVRSHGTRSLLFAMPSALAQVKDTFPRREAGCSTASAPTVSDDGGITFKDKTTTDRNPWTSFLKSRPWKVDAGASKGQDLSQDAAKDRPAPPGRLLQPGALNAHDNRHWQNISIEIRTTTKTDVLMKPFVVANFTTAGHEEIIMREDPIELRAWQKAGWRLQRYLDPSEASDVAGSGISGGDRSRGDLSSSGSAIKAVRIRPGKH